METVILVFGALILGAFAIRVIIASLDVIYKIAPWIVMCIAAIVLMYMFANDDFQKVLHMKGNNAPVTQTIED
jgi:hypothetical protein